MNGKIVVLATADKSGLISGSDGHAYAFSSSTVIGVNREQRIGQEASFTIDDGEARQVVLRDAWRVSPDFGARWSVPRGFWLCVLLVVFLAVLWVVEVYFGLRLEAGGWRRF